MTASYPATKLFYINMDIQSMLYTHLKKKNRCLLIFVGGDFYLKSFFPSSSSCTRVPY